MDPVNQLQGSISAMKKLLLASTRQSLLVTWKDELEDLSTSTYMVDRLSGLLDHVTRLKPAMLLVDFDMLHSGGMDVLRMLSPGTRIAVVGDVISEEMEWGFLKAGVRGCCQGEKNTQLLRQVVEAVLQGELWIRRSLTGRLIDELSSASALQQAHQPSRGLLNILTPREYDIAVRVGSGDNNKQIANSCGITERTVKAHLTGIFNKLGVSGRLNLALLISAEERGGAKAAANPEMLAGIGAGLGNIRPGMSFAA